MVLYIGFRLGLLQMIKGVTMNSDIRKHKIRKFITFRVEAPLKFFSLIHKNSLNEICQRLWKISSNPILFILQIVDAIEEGLTNTIKNDYKDNAGSWDAVQKEVLLFSRIGHIIHIMEMCHLFLHKFSSYLMKWQEACFTVFLAY